MSKNILPKQIEPIRLADRRAQLEGIIALAEMPRLSALLHDANGEVIVRLVFSVDAQGTYAICGKASVDVQLMCQRCMQPFAYRLASEIQLSPVSSEKAAAELPSAYEAVMVSEEGIVMLNDMVEDELILGLPLVTVHEPSACQVKMISSKPEVTKPNAFEVLKSLKKD